MKTRKMMISLAFLLVLPFSVFAGKLMLKRVKVQEQQQADGTLQIYVKFEMPVFSQKVHIDYVNLKLGLDFMEPISASQAADGGNLVQVLGAAADGKGADAALGYNTYPVTGRLPKGRSGATVVAFDLTQMARLWASAQTGNHGILLVSHRKTARKALQTGKLGLATSLKPEVTIYYTP